ncbi:uncharacterized protein EHS24_002047 [Apiotrichum porosum]|uniref:Etoposide-induced protein 2.4-domain-containing protein n=1 Tax=Apiotrichum porosum TaxID=105984 RepID=A0A427XHK2_9TREE|nr:uncharacterized protein EHS24_002047 [Apiotrichum porosum]RSH78328.1 hypothetical protein EHS24_002047 [Apiotrichum porosum]
MLHQRRRQPEGGAAPPPPVSTSKPSNNAYVPLRRPSGSALPPPPVPGEPNGFDSYNGGSYGHLASGSYHNPSVASAPSLPRVVGQGQGYTPSHGRGMSLGLGGGPFSPAVEFTDDTDASAVGQARRAIEAVRSGVRDAVRLDRSMGLVWGDMELRSLVLKVTLINLLSLLLLSMFPLVLSPIFQSQGIADGAATRTREIGFWYNVLLSWPTFAVCFWINAIWGPDVARRAQAMLHPAYRLSSSTAPQNPAPTVFSDPVAWAWVTVMRLLLIADFTLVGRTIALVPVLGVPIGLAYMSLINCYYPYEWIFTARGWSLDTRCSYISDRSAYMLGFGLPATLLTSFGPPLVNMAVFALIYPFLLIQALQSRPPSVHSLLPATPSPGSSNPTTPTSELPPSLLTMGHVGGNGGGLGAASYTSGPIVRVPVFFFARHALSGLQWLADAVARERGGYAASRRRGPKRAF